MKKALLLLGGAFLIFALVRDKGFAPPAEVSAAASRIAFPFKLAALAMEKPDLELAMPVEGVRVKYIKDTWHAPRSGGRRHEGQDIFAKQGTPVRSSTSGYVINIGENQLGGKVVYVLGAGGRTYYYAHLDAYSPDVAVGDEVSRETILGYVGTTGNAAGTPPHLHFGVYDSTQAIDPLPLLVDLPARPINLSPSNAR